MARPTATTLESPALAAIDSAPTDVPAPARSGPGIYAWIVFALTFGLLISDYMSRQVLNAVFPLLKAEWALSDTQLGSLSGVISLMVGLLTIPLSLLAERFGRVRSLVAMAILWSVATLGCAIARSYDEMLIARFLVGLGEAAYGSVGIALVLSVFPPRMRATLTGAFMAGGMAGSVLGVTLGGVVAVALGWRWAFAAMALFGLALAIPYPFIVRDGAGRKSPSAPAAAPVTPWPQRLLGLISSRSLICAYLGSGLQLFIAGSVIAWMPSYLGRYYHLAPDKAGAAAGGLMLLSGAGMVIWGMVSDRLSKAGKPRSVTLAVGLCGACFALLAAAFQLPPGPAQLVLIAAGLFVAAGVTGPSGAMVANLTRPAMHGAAFAVLTLANNLLGLAPGPVVTGALADRIGLQAAFQWIPLVCLASAACFWIARLSYRTDLVRVDTRDAVTA
jgi:MFS family permease